MIRYSWFFYLLLSFFFFHPAYGQSETTVKSGITSGIFQPLKVGQKVSVKENYGFWEVSVLNNGEIGVSTIVEIRPTHLVIIDPMQIAKSWIPISSINKVTVLKILGVDGQLIKP